MNINIRTITKEEERASQFCNMNRAKIYAKSRNRTGIKHRAVKSIVKRFDGKEYVDLYCFTITLV